MSDKNKVVETNEVSEIIKNILNKPDSNIYITDGTEEINILLDNNAINLLKAYYKSKFMRGDILNG